MKFAELKTQLLSVGATINSITEDTTNWGGCCVVAAVVGKRLRELGVPVRAVVATYQGLSLLDREPTDRGDPDAWARVGIYFNHVGLEFKAGNRWHYFDSEGVKPRQRENNKLPAGDWPVIPGQLTVDEVAELASNPHRWNPVFPRHTIPAIEEAVYRMLQ